MCNRKLMAMAACLAGAVALGQFGAVGKTPSAPPEETPAKVKAEPEPGKGQRAEAFIAAFNKGDAKTVAGFWTPEGDYVDQVGH